MDFLDTEEMDGSELNEKIAAAADILEKLAEEQGVDLNTLSDDEIGELVGEIIKSSAEGESSDDEEDMTEEEKKDEEEDDEESDKEKSAADVTYADVACELAKVAAANNIDMNKVSREEYTQAFDAIAAQLTDPEAHAQKVAAEQEYQAKIAELEEAGRTMARAFADELGIDKEAANLSVSGKGAYNLLKGKLQSAGGSVKALAGKAGGKAKEVSSKAGDVAERVGRKAVIAPSAAMVGRGPRLTRAGVKGVSAGSNMTRGQAQAITAALGTTGVAGLGAAGYGVNKAVKKSSDEEFEAAALEIAQQYVDKIASENAVYERAAEILAENGIEI